uniref:Autophagy-related protein 27 n=1 Tax=Macrostomum lignano TaxID=282301 RepID=A0A1I8FML4_9PLAT
MGLSSRYNYLYNPCTGQRCDSSQGDAASCQRSTDRRYEYLLGTQSTAQFSTEPQAGLQLTYSALSGDGKRRSAQVQLVCDQSASVPKFEALDDGSVGPQLIVYKMRLTSKHCCEQSGGGGGGGGGGLSGGDILLIVFFCLVFVYVAGGLAFNALVRKLPVYPDSVPNREFWLALPFLVRTAAMPGPLLLALLMLPGALGQPGNGTAAPPSATPSSNQSILLEAYQVVALNFQYRRHEWAFASVKYSGFLQFFANNWRLVARFGGTFQYDGSSYYSRWNWEEALDNLVAYLEDLELYHRVYRHLTVRPRLRAELLHRHPQLQPVVDEFLEFMAKRDSAGQQATGYP